MEGYNLSISPARRLEPAPDRRPGERTASRPAAALLLLAFAAIYLIWGSTFLAIRYAVETIPPLLTMSVRSAGAGASLFALARLRGDAAPDRRQWGQAFVVGGLLFLVCHGVLAWAEQHIASGPAALLSSTIPLWMVVLDWLAGTGPRPRALVVCGLAIGFAGVAMLVLPAERSGEGGVDLVTGGVMMLGSISWAWGSLYSRRAGFPESIPLTTGMQLLAGGCLLFLVSMGLGEGHRLSTAALAPRSVWSLLYLIVFGSVVAFTAYNWLLRVMTPARLSTYSYVNPVVAVLLGWLFAGEPLGLRVLLPTAVIVVGVGLTLVAKARTRA